jgi:hypothetical protein
MNQGDAVTETRVAFSTENRARYSDCGRGRLFIDSPHLESSRHGKFEVVRPLLHLIFGLGLFVASTCSATVITVLGENTTNAASWRTSSVAKAINPANNNIYGNDGYVMFNTAPTTSTLTQSNSSINPFTFSASSQGLATLNVAPSYVSSFTAIGAPSSGFNSVYTSNSYLTMDKPGGGSMLSGVAYEGGSTSSFTNLFTFTLGSHVPSTFVVGLFFNNGLGEWAQAQISGGGATATATRAGFGNIDAIFFRISSATAGTTFTVSGETSLRGEANGNLDITGITFDSVPEPTTLGGTALAALALVWFGRKKKARA